MNTNKDISIYIHIPFCKSKCYYCDFVSYTNKDELVNKYIDSVCKEILNNSEILADHNIYSIYFGGGTPSYINSKYISKIMDTLRLFNISQDAEVTIELNPGTVTEEKITDYINCGINRVSIGIQSTHDDVLKNIGRIHNYSEAINTLRLIKSLGLKNKSIDLIYPLPGLNLEKFNNTLNDIDKLVNEYDIKHVSIYNLEVHKGSKIDFLINENFLTLPDEDEEYIMRKSLNEKLNLMGFFQYEISNYAKKGFESKHNLVYWHQEQYLGFGVSASSFFMGMRYTNVAEIPKYIEYIDNGTSIVSEQIQLDKLGLMKEYMMLNLRLTEGIDIADFKSRFKTDIFSLFKIEIDKLIELKLLEYNQNAGKIFLSDRGKEIANQVWLEFV